MRKVSKEEAVRQKAGKPHMLISPVLDRPGEGQPPTSVSRAPVRSWQRGQPLSYYSHNKELVLNWGEGEANVICFIIIM